MPCYHFKTPGFLVQEVPEELRPYFIQKRKEVTQDPSKFQSAAGKLAGSIKKEFYFEDQNLQLIEFLFKCVEEYEGTFDYLRTFVTDAGQNVSRELYLSSLWINLQERYEHNPPHNHSGVFSFVIWTEIPYDWEKEQEMFPEKKTQAEASFFFHFISTLGEIGTQVLPVDKSFEWKIAMFPAKLHHSVAPFLTCDGTRVSFAGNLSIREVYD